MNFNQEGVDTVLATVSTLLFLKLIFYVFLTLYMWQWCTFFCTEVSWGMAIYRWNMYEGSSVHV